MLEKNADLHGNAPDKSDVALLLIDVINDLEFPEGDQLLCHALPMAQRIAAYKKRARQEGVPVLYVNDNYGRWRSDFMAQVERCLKDGVRGQPVVELLRPDEEDYFVLKPKHSGFFSTTLDILLEYLGGPGGGPDGDSGEHLRLVHGQRHLHARLASGGAVRLCGLQHRGGESLCPGPDAQGTEGRHPSVHGTVLSDLRTEGGVRCDTRLGGPGGKG